VVSKVKRRRFHVHLDYLEVWKKTSWIEGTSVYEHFLWDSSRIYFDPIRIFSAHYKAEVSCKKKVWWYPLEVDEQQKISCDWRTEKQLKWKGFTNGIPKRAH